MSALTLNNLGLAEQNLGKNDKALEYYLRCLEIQ